MSDFWPRGGGPFASCALCCAMLTLSGVRAAEPATEIDRQLRSELFAEAKGVTLAPRADDETFLRRAYLDTVGENPTPGEVAVFALDPAADKRERLIKRLLDDPRYGTNWARYWRDVIIARSSAVERQIQAIVANPLEIFLAERFNANDGWDRIARAFIEAEGTVSEQGETALFMVHMAQTANVAAETSRIFLGMQIQCAECHDHPFDQWKRPQFHEFAAFFPRVGVQRERATDGRPNLRIASFDNGPIARPPNSQQGGQEHFMPDPKQPANRGTLMTPVFFATGQSLKIGATDAERRAALGGWLTARENPWFAKALVNRLWAELVGQGFCEPVDDLGPDRPCAAPRTWDYLSREFARRNYDLKWLFQTILTSDAYQRECRPKPVADAIPFTANVRQRLRADQLVDVLTAAVGVPLTGGRAANAGGGIVPNNGPRFPWLQLFGFDPSVRREEVTSTIPQALTMMNSPLLHRQLGAGGNSWFSRLLATTPDDDAVVQELYLRCVAREPTAGELRICREHVRAVGIRSAALEDIFWSLLNSEEIRYRN